MEKASAHLTPVSLELGGKSPVIVDETADIALTAKRLAWGKCVNAGQTCVAPDYVLVHHSREEALIEALIKEIREMYTSAPLANPILPKIVNQRHFERIRGLIDPAKVVHGGKSDASTMRIEPTVMDNVTWNDPVMQEEIFGPILPILTYDSFDEAIATIESGERPLAGYIFSENKAHIAEFVNRCRFGGGCVNDVVIHLATSEMGFGGVGESGMGAYHGKTGFDAFSHLKSILDKKTWMDLPMRYQPYNKFYGKLLRLFLR
jgi:aldehyde dehydrogenase (NAD+)